ncbi:MAG: prepilin-type N-terminal cleavage/methylation domain-containing protein [Deltaproteobacteria bacterium]|nr:prepilin-type N-terminal cleavage/methylation domain-containing protein [Deltaproteobacteria bacterium]
MKKNRSSGFSLLELIIVMALIGILAAIVSNRYLNYVEEARVAKATADIRVIESEIYVYKMKTGELPESLGSVKRSAFKDPWGHYYCYMKIGDDKDSKGKARKDGFLVPINSDFDLYSSGRDGRSVSSLRAKGSRDDIVRAFNGGYVGPASKI